MNTTSPEYKIFETSDDEEEEDLSITPVIPQQDQKEEPEDEREAKEEKKPKRQLKKKTEKAEKKTKKTKKTSEDKPNRQPKKKEPSKPKVPRVNNQQFNNKTLLHYLNSSYNGFRFRDLAMKKDNKKANFIVNMDDYRAIDEFKQVMVEFEKIPQTEDKIKEREKWDTITHSVVDFKLRGILTLVNDHELVKRDEDTKERDTSLFDEKIIPQLHFDEPEEFNIDKIKENIVNFLAGDKIKFKLYNCMFPHPSSAKTETAAKSRLSKIYLQNMSAYHDDYLNMLYSGKVSSADDLFNFAVDKIVERSTTGVTKERLLNMSFGKSTKIKLTDEDKKFIVDEKQARFEHTVADRYYKCYALALEQELINKKDAKKLYNDYLAKINDLKLKSKTIGKQKIIKVEQLIKIFIQVFQELNECLKYNFSLKSFISDIESTNSLIFTQKFKQVLMRTIKGEDCKIEFIENTKRFKANVWIKDRKTGEKKEKTVEDAIIQTKRHTFENTKETLAKIGLMVGNNIAKNIRIALGIAIIDFIHNQTLRITEKSRLPKKTVYIDF